MARLPEQGAFRKPRRGGLAPLSCVRLLRFVPSCIALKRQSKQVRKQVREICGDSVTNNMRARIYQGVLNRGLMAVSEEFAT
jgi:hypothetical protein